jgi:vacuolar-type H+-ATPase subunit H
MRLEIKASLISQGKSEEDAERMSYAIATQNWKKSHGGTAPQRMSGIFLSDEACQNLVDGHKSMILKPLECKLYPGKEIFFLSANKVYGTLSLSDAIEITPEKFIELSPKHLVNQTLSESYWGKDAKLYGYEFKLNEVFKPAKSYNLKGSMPNFLSDVTIDMAELSEKVSSTMTLSSEVVAKGSVRKIKGVALHEGTFKNHFYPKEVIKNSASKLLNKGLRLEHGKSADDVIGYVSAVDFDDTTTNLNVEAVIFDPSVIQRFDSGIHETGFSVGVKLDAEPDGDHMRVTGINDWLELTVCEMPACPDCRINNNTQVCMLSETVVEEAVWDTAYVNNLPDSAFAYVESGDKDESGRTVPRTNRHLPYRNMDGTVDLAHLRNALARLPQTQISDEAKAQARRVLEKAAEGADVKVSESKDEVKEESKMENQTVVAEPAKGVSLEELSVKIDSLSGSIAKLVAALEKPKTDSVSLNETVAKLSAKVEELSQEPVRKSEPSAPVVAQELSIPTGREFFKQAAKLLKADMVGK